MKMNEEGNALREETVNEKLRELTDEEMTKVNGGYSVDTVFCDGCKICIGVCPIGAIQMQNGKAHIVESACVFCGQCCNACPCGAITPF